jgi:deoxyribonuclease V
MIAAVDVSYHTDRTIAAAVLFPDWASDTAVAQVCHTLQKALHYEPGHFYRRELPGLLQVLNTMENQFDTVVIDGYVWLASRKAGLGRHLHMALGGHVPVVGVAKSQFKGAQQAQQVFRGRSRRPLFVTAAGMDVLMAASHVRSMHGPYRIPTMLKLVDRICRFDGRAGRCNITT